MIGLVVIACAISIGLLLRIIILAKTGTWH
jgi:hypothetical protein